MSTMQNTLLSHLRSLAAKQASRALSDRELLDAFLTQRSEMSFSALLRRHGPMVWNVCRRVLRNHHDAEDAFQAVFLVFVRKAASIRKQESLSSFLHSIAYRVATRMKIAAARRAVRERTQARPPFDEPCDDLSWRELRSVLDEELAQLPEQQRAPLVLCYLEGKTQDEAARLLGWSKRTIRRRLDQGRDALGRRLTRRGITLSAALSASLLADAAAQAALPPLLVANTVRAGLAAVMGNTTSGIVTAQVIALAESGTASLLTKKAGLALILLASLTVGIGGLLAHRAIQGRTSAEALAAPPAPMPPSSRSASKDNRIEIKGRVLGPDGKPFAGARLFLCSDSDQKKADIPVRATTDMEGRFHFTARAADFGPQGKSKIVAMAKGWGLDWIDVSAKGMSAEITLRLVADNKPIEGRLLDLEGQPIAGATVQVRSVRKQADGGELSSWVERNAKTGWVQDSELDKMKLLLPAGLDVPALVTSGVDGRFRLIGFGRERVLRLAVRGPAIADADFFAATRTGPAKGWISGEFGLYGARFDFVMAPCKPIVGTVRDRRTGKPLAGITVAAAVGHWCKTKTDNQGHYRIVGIAKSKEYAVGAGGMPYINCPKNHVADTPGLEPLTVNFELDRGIAVKGRLIDKTTGKPVRGHVYYRSLPDNPHLKDFTDLNKGGISPYDPGDTAADGSFAVVAIPGSGWIGATANAANRFVRANVKEGAGLYHAVVRINPSENDPQSTACEIALEPANVLKGSVVGPDGKPLLGVYTAGLSPVVSPELFSQEKLETNSFQAGGVKAGHPRTLVFLHPEKKLGKVVKLQGDEKEPLLVRLKPLGAIAGRILDAKGRPWAGLNVWVRVTFKDKTYPPEFGWVPSAWWKLTQFETTTDRRGKFRIEGLLPGLKYDLIAAEGAVPPELAPYRAEAITVESGKTKDLGDIKSTLVPEKGAKEKP